MKPIDVAGFERKFRENIDPWDYTNSQFEDFKRKVLLQACGHHKHGRVLELGCAIGETTVRLFSFFVLQESNAPDDPAVFRRSWSRATGDISRRSDGE
jgi:hypothetical protein